MIEEKHVMNNIRLVNKPFFKGYTFQKEVTGRYLIVEGAVGFEKYQKVYEALLTPFEYSIIEKVYDYSPNKNNFKMNHWVHVKDYIKDILTNATSIIEAMSLEEVEFIDLNKEAFDKWKTFRKWCHMVELDGGGINSSACEEVNDE